VTVVFDHITLIANENWTRYEIFGNSEDIESRFLQLVMNSFIVNFSYNQSITRFDKDEAI